VLKGTHAPRQIYADAPDLLMSHLTGLADALCDLGDHDVACALCDEVLSGARPDLGANDPQSVSALSRWTVARLYCDEAVDHDGSLEAFVSVARPLLAAGHPLVMEAAESLIAALHALRLPIGGLTDILQAVIDAHVRALSPDHQETVRAMNNLSMALAEFMQWRAVVRLRQEVVARLLWKFVATQHADMVNAMISLADALQRAGDSIAARQMEARAEDLAAETLARTIRSLEASTAGNHLNPPTGLQ